MVVEGGSDVLLRNVRFHRIPLNIQFLISAGDVFPQVLRQISLRHGIGEIRMLQHAEVAQAADQICHGIHPVLDNRQVTVPVLRRYQTVPNGVHISSNYRNRRLQIV